MTCSGPNSLPSLLNSTLSKYLKLPVGHTHRPHAEPALQIVDTVEVDEPLQRLAQRSGVVKTLRLRAALRPQRRRRNPRREEAGRAEGRNHRCAGFVIERALPISFGDRSRNPRRHRRDHLPEFFQPVDALRRLIAGNERGIDRADRDPRNPFRFEIEVAERLVCAGLIGTKRTTTLKDEYALCFCGRRCHHRLGYLIAGVGTRTLVRGRVNRRGR